MNVPKMSVPKMRTCLIMIAGLAALNVLVGCQGEPSSTAAPNKAVKDYALRGVVREVDVAGNEVVLKHEAIDGYMTAMTMPFTVKQGALPEGLKPGDKVAGTLRVTSEDSEVVELLVTERAPEADQKPVLLLKDVPPLQPGEEVPDFTLTTQEGETLSLSDLRGKVVVLTFIYTRCPLPDVCPLMDRKFRDLSDAIKVLPGWSDQVRLLSVSFDPEHDTPEVLAKHARLNGATPPLWTFAVASHKELQKVAPQLDLMYAPMKTEVIHTLSTSVIDPDGRLVLRQSGMKEGRTWTTGELLKAVKPLLPPLRK